jgi:hypothetical protein
LPFDWAQAAWFVFYLLAACSLPYLLFPHAPRWLILTLPVLYPVTFALILGNYVFLIGLILLFTCALVVLPPDPDRKWQILAGILLAWTTIKPQFVWLYLAFLALYTLRTPALGRGASFNACIGGLLLFSWLVVPTWLTDWLHQVQTMRRCKSGRVERTQLAATNPAEAWLAANGQPLALFFWLPRPGSLKPGGRATCRACTAWRGWGWSPTCLTRAPSLMSRLRWWCLSFCGQLQPKAGRRPWPGWPRIVLSAGAFSA